MGSYKNIGGELKKFSGSTVVDEKMSKTSKNPLSNMVTTKEIENINKKVSRLTDDFNKFTKFVLTRL